MARFKNTDWRKTLVAWPLMLAFALGVVSLTYGALQLRVLAFDGADFSYYILTRGSSVRNFALYRYTSELQQIPALLSIRYLGFGAMSLTRWILAFSNSWFPIVGVFAAVALCLFYRKPKIALGPLMTFGFVSLPIAGLPFSAVPEAIFFFWIAYLIQVYGRRLKLENTALFLSCLALAFTHETAFLLPLLLLVLAIWQKYRLALWLHLLSLAGFAIRVFDMSGAKINQTASKTWSGIDPYAASAAGFLLFLLLSTTISRFLPLPWRRRSFKINLLLGCASLTYFALNVFLSGQSGIYNTYIWRMYATGLLTLIAATFWMADTSVSRIRDEYDAPFPAAWWKYLYASTLAALLTGASLDYSGSLIWRSEVDQFRNYVASRPESCVKIPWKTYKRELRLWQLQAYNVAKVWALIQKSGHVDKFVYVDVPDRLAHLRKDVCAQLNGNLEIDADHSLLAAPYFNLNKEAFDYSFLRDR
jgi:hypothetical protein